MYQALSYGIPVLCKTAHVEQEYNVEGVERLQLGKNINHFQNEEDYLAVVEEWIKKEKQSSVCIYKKENIAGEF